MTTKKYKWLIKIIFPTIQGLTFLFLFWLISGFFFRDATRIFWWSTGGFTLGLISGVVLQLALNKFLWATHTKTYVNKTAIFTVVIVVEFALGLFIIGPLIWVENRFLPNSNLHSICCETPLDYGAKAFEEVRLNTTDGAIISGWYVAPTQQTGKIIILIHGNGYDRRGTDFYTKQLIAAGYGVFLYDLRDHGESAGKLNAFNRMAAYAKDLRQVIDYLKQKPEINPKHIGIVGISLGAFATLNSTPETLNSLAALWLDGLVFENFGALIPPTTSKEAAKYIFDRQTRYFASLLYVEPITPPTPLLKDIIPTLIKPKVMIVASGLDERERPNNEKLVPLMGGNKSIWFIKNAWHIGGRFEVPDEYRERMLVFFAQAFAD